MDNLIKHEDFTAQHQSIKNIHPYHIQVLIGLSP